MTLFRLIFNIVFYKKGMSARLLFVFLIAASVQVPGQNAKVYEEIKSLPTYAFSDPDPVTEPGRIFPYFRFDGYSTTPKTVSHRMIVLENNWIKVWIAPGIGGKIYGALDKKTGRYFIYNNNVVKFRDIAMRGPWASGGIEFNFGSIGHAPTTATPVDFHYQSNPDGSVSCYVGATELTSRTEWRVEIRLPADKAWFETIVNWQNPTPGKTSLYHWANASADAGDDLRFYYPGNAYIGHEGRASEWPVTGDGRDISWYRNNDYGADHSYHIIGEYTDWFAGYYHNDNFGFGHWGRFAYKPGKKIWIWSLSRQGAIWKDLLTDKDNRQYVEIQTGFLFNQESDGSTMTPFKHMYLMPGAIETATERWFPLSGLKNVSEISDEGILDLTGTGSNFELRFQSLCNIDDTLVIKARNGEKIFSAKIKLAPQEIFSSNLKFPDDTVTILLKNGNLEYNYPESRDKTLERPVEMERDFNWESVYGLYTRGIEKSRQRSYEAAKDYLNRCIKKDPDFIPAYTALAEINYKQLDYNTAERNLLKVISFDTYDPDANFLYGTILEGRGEYYKAKAAYGLASRSTEFKSAALQQLATIALKEKKYDEAWEYISLAVSINGIDHNTFRLAALASRLRNDNAGYAEFLNKLSALDPLDHFTRFEKYLISHDPLKLQAFREGINTELKHETYIELALWYKNAGCIDEAVSLLLAAPEHPLVHYLLSYFFHEKSDEISSEANLEKALTGNPEFVFPYREEYLPVLEWADNQKDHWKTKYFLSILLWTRDQAEKAREYLTACADQPDIYSFYLTRGNFFRSAGGGNVEEEFIKALNHGNGEWRPYHELCNYYTSGGLHNKSLEVAGKAIKLFGDSYIIRFDYATSLLNNGYYEECVNILKKTEILPFEGAAYGRTAWRDANILSALMKYSDRDYRKALTYVNDAYSWPENLGVGKPYIVDETTEDFVKAMILEKSGKGRDANALYSKIAARNPSLIRDAGSVNYLTVLALQKLNRPAEADEFFKKWLGTIRNNRISDWAQAISAGQKEKAAKLVNTPEDINETSRRIRGDGDSNLKIINEIAQQIK